MQYSLKKITTVEQCDALLTKAQKKKQRLEQKRRRLGESLDKFRARLSNMNEEALIVRISIDAFNVGYNALPEGNKYKADLLVKIKRMEVRQARVELKGLTCNVATLLVKEMQYNALDSQVAAVTQHIAAVKYLRMNIGKGALRVSRKNTHVSAEGQRAVDRVPQAYAGLTSLPLSIANSQEPGVLLASGVRYTPFEYRSPWRMVKTG